MIIYLYRLQMLLLQSVYRSTHVCGMHMGLNTGYLVRDVARGGGLLMLAGKLFFSLRAPLGGGV
jgi:hypothetical protein